MSSEFKYTKKQIDKMKLKIEMLKNDIEFVEAQTDLQSCPHTRLDTSDWKRELKFFEEEIKNA